MSNTAKFWSVITGIAVVLGGGYVAVNHQPSKTATITLPPQLSTPLNSTLVVEAESSTTDIDWAACDDSITLTAVPNTTKVYLVGSKPGAFHLVARVAAGSKITKAQSLIVVGTGPGPNPDPGPVPPPDPGPKPIPKITQLYWVVIEDTASAKADRAAYYANKDLIDYLTSHKMKKKIEDKAVVGPDKNPPKDLAPYLNLAKTKTLPYSWLVNQDGHTLWEGPLPAKVSDMVSTMKQINP